MKYLLFRKK